MSRAGINTLRRLTVGSGGSTIGSEYRDMIRGGNPPLLYRAIIYEIIFDPRLLTQEDLNNLKNMVANPEYVELMPANSIIGKISAESHQNLDTAPMIFFPLFSSHISLPLQVGEHVYICFEDQQFQGMKLGRWIDRIHEYKQVEDLNYTHADRRFDPSLNPDTSRVEDQRRQANSTRQNNRPGFPNGTGTDGNYSIALDEIPGERSQNPYDKLVNNSLSGRQGVYESVPRFTKRPQDFVLQGMNNTLICLGQDRINTANRATDQEDKRKKAGAIDIVVGRGRFPAQESDRRLTDEKTTSALVVQNARNYLETDKNPSLNNKPVNLKEGDPSFEHDAARIYLAMNTNGDKNLGLLEGNKISYPDKTLKITEQVQQISDDIGASYGIIKADNLRFVARKKETNPEINGSILLIKEGTKDNDLSYLLITKEGKVELEGNKIYFGKAVTENENEIQPYIKFQEYKATIQHLQSQIDSLRDYIQANIGTALTTAMRSAVAIPYSPVASLVASSAPLQTATQNLTTELTQKSGQTNEKINSCKSQKIFGE